MSLLSPLAFALAGLTLRLVLLYFLKVRRRERAVPSLLLWSTAKRDREASAFFQRLQRDPLIILQILALLALALALARPAVTVMGPGNKRVVLVVDAAATMKATDVSPSRFVRAQRDALRRLAQLGEGAEVMVIQAAIQPRVVVPFTRDRERVVAGIWSLGAQDIPSRLAEAVRTARALVGQDARAEIYVFTDGANSSALGAQGDDVRVRWVGVGTRGRNVAITNFGVRRNYLGTFGSQAFASVANFSDQTQRLSFALTVDDKTVAEQALELGPQVRRALVLPFTHEGGGVVRARLRVSDDLESDNVAQAVIP